MEIEQPPTYSTGGIILAIPVLIGVTVATKSILLGLVAMLVVLLPGLIADYLHGREAV